MDWKQQFREKFTDEKGEEWVAGRDYSPSPKAIESFIQELVEKTRNQTLDEVEEALINKYGWDDFIEKHLRDELQSLRPPAQTGEEHE